MSNKTIPQLTENTTPKITDIVYVAKRNQTGSYADRKVSLENMSLFTLRSRTKDRSSDYVISNSSCDKRWFSNRHASGAVIFTLPTSSIGEEVEFVVEESKVLQIQPQATQVILPTGGTVGVAIISSVIGSTISLRGYADGWHVLSEIGVWTVAP